MNGESYFTNVVTQPNELAASFNGLYFEATCVQYANLLRAKYPTATVETKQVFGMVPCWQCGEPIFILNKDRAENLCQKVAKICCSDNCEYDKRKHYT